MDRAHCGKCGARLNAVRGVSLLEQRHGEPCGGPLVAGVGRRRARRSAGRGYRVRTITISEGYRS